MAAVHTDAAAIFGGNLVNEAEEKIQFVKHRPVGHYDSKSPITFIIPGNTNQYVSLRDSYFIIECHLEETDSSGKPKQGRFTRSVSDTEEEEEEEGDDPPEKRRKRAVTTKTYEEILEMEEQAAERYRLSVEAREQAETLTDAQERKKMQDRAAGLEDFALRAMREYLKAKRGHRRAEGLDGSLVPLDNVMHSLFNGVDVTMNHELVSTTNQKYMYKAYIETVLNNSASTKKYQLQMQGYYGDSGHRDTDFNISYNKGMEKRYMAFRNGKKVQLQGFLLSDIMGIHAAIVNGVEITITLQPNLDSIRVQGFGTKPHGQMVIDSICMYACKRQMSKEVVVAHADIMETGPAIYPFKRSEVRAYNGHKGQSEITIENPYESKVPTRLLVAMVDSAAYMGHSRLNPLNFQHFNIRRASFKIDDESVAKPPYNLDVSRNKVIEPLMELYSILGKVGEDRDIGISLEEFKDGLFILPFDVTPTSSANMEYLAKKEGGNCTLELQFHQPLPKDIMILTYAIFPAELLIDAARNCLVRAV